MSDTRVLLGQIRELRLRLAQVHGGNAYGPPDGDILGQPEHRPTGESQRQLLLDASIRQLTAEIGSAEIRPKRLIAKVRHQLERGRQIVGRLQQLANDPVLHRGDPAGPEPDDPLLASFRETSAMTEASLRLVQAFPDAPSAQLRLGEGLENILHAIDDRVTTLSDSVAARGGEHQKRDCLAEQLEQLHAGRCTSPAAFVEIAGEILHEVKSGAQLRFVHAHPKHLSRFVAAHSITCARIAARMIKHDAEWQRHASEAVVAALLKDVGMLDVPSDDLSESGRLTDEARRKVERHAQHGAALVAQALPARAALCEAIVAHHERLDGTGYPGGLKEAQIGRLPRLLALADVYAAMCAPRPHRPAYDPRTALTETLQLAERGQMDRDLAQRLLTLSFYPVGTVVELADGSVGVVVATHQNAHSAQSASRPVLAILADESGRLLPAPKHVDLADSEGRSILRALTESERKAKLGRKYPEYT